MASAVLRRVFSGRVQCAHGAAELRGAPAGGRFHRKSDPATHSQISHNR